MIGDKFKDVIKMAFFLSLLLTLFLPNISWSYNKSWDQGHLCINPSGGDTGWGRYGYDTTSPDDFKDGYSSKDCCELLCKICPVYANTGRLQKTYTDLTLPGVGPALNIVRTYDSQEWATSLLGHGWIFNFGKRLIIVRNKQGDKILIVHQGTGELNFFKEHSDGYLEQLTKWGLTYEFTKNPDGSYTIKERNGTRYEIKADGKIREIVDKNGNKLVFEYSAVGCLSRITNASGNYVTFQLGLNGKVASISDNIGRTVTYTYDQNGNLISFTDPMGNITQYRYNSNNLLTQIIDARGNVIESATYDNNQPSRVSTFTEKGETYTIAYYTGYTVKTDSKGNRWTYYYNDVGVITKVIDPLGSVKEQSLNKITATSKDWEKDLNGNITTYTYDAYGNITSKTDPLGNTTLYTYITGTNLLATETNPLGVVTNYEYDANGNIVKLVRDYGGFTESVETFTYNSLGKRTSMTDPLGTVTHYQYDSNGNMTIGPDHYGNRKTYTYDQRGNLLSEIDEKGNKVSYTYDLLDSLTSVTDALGKVTTFQYDANGNMVSATYPNGSINTFTYDAYNRLIQKTDPLGNKKSYTYNANDRVTTITDVSGNVTAYVYDSNGRLIRETDVMSGTTSYTHDANGNILTLTNANGKTTSFTYDATNRKTSETNAAGESTLYHYDAAGNLLSQTLSNGNIITKAYDDHNHVIAESDIVGKLKTYTYNLAGWLVKESDSLGNMTLYAYNAIGMVVKITDADGNSVLYSYDPVGNLTSITDREGNITQYQYDANNRKISETDPQGNITAFTYDDMGNLRAITDANGNITTYTYDQANRVISITYADATSINFAYDKVGNLISRKDQNGQITTYVYDALNRRTKVEYPESDDNVYSFDKIGNITSATNKNTTVIFQYDNVNRIVQTSQNGKAVTYSYDVANNTTTITYPSGRIIKQVTNPRDLLLRVENGSSQTIVQYTYNTASTLGSMSYLNGIETNFTTNANGWVTGLTYSAGGAPIMDLDYGYNNEGATLYAKKLHDATLSEQFIFDLSYRLIQYRRGALNNENKVVSPNYQIQYTLDALGNWQSQIRNGQTENRVHNHMNETVDIDGVKYSYDANGNLTDDGMYTYKYDFENRLVKITNKFDNSIVAEFEYDALGRRTKKSTTATIVEYVYDDNRVIETYNGSNNLQHQYIYGKTNDVVSMVDKDNNKYYYLRGATGNVLGITDATGSVVERYEYDPYGNMSLYNSNGNPIQVSAIGNPMFFKEKYFDAETGLYYDRARYYSSYLGRYIQRKETKFKANLNFYEYQPITTAFLDLKVPRRQGSGTTSCDPSTGNMVKNVTEHCAGNCVDLHENIHVNNNAACCTAYKKCLDSGTTGCNTAWTTWWNDAGQLNWDECLAYSAHETCLLNLRNKQLCCDNPGGPVGTTAACCNSLKSHLNNVQTQKPGFCGGQAQKPCPFNANGTIK